jgi:hypothetical protein
MPTGRRTLADRIRHHLRRPKFLTGLNPVEVDQKSIDILGCPVMQPVCTRKQSRVEAVGEGQLHLGPGALPAWNVIGRRTLTDGSARRLGEVYAEDRPMRSAAPPASPNTPGRCCLGYSSAELRRLAERGAVNFAPLD